jgi:hypothetical protein
MLSTFSLCTYIYPLSLILKNKTNNIEQTTSLRKMAPQANLSIAKIGYEIEKFFGRQKSFGNNSNTPATQNLCQYKCYPTYGATTITKVVHTNIVEDLTCNEAASRFIEEKRKDQLHVKGLIGQ